MWTVDAVNATRAIPRPHMHVSDTFLQVNAAWRRDVAGSSPVIHPTFVQVRGHKNDHC